VRQADVGQAAGVAFVQVPALLPRQRGALVVQGKAHLLQGLEEAVHRAAAQAYLPLDLGDARPCAPLEQGDGLDQLGQVLPVHGTRMPPMGEGRRSPVTFGGPGSSSRRLPRPERPGSRSSAAGWPALAHPRPSIYLPQRRSYHPEDQYVDWHVREVFQGPGRWMPAGGANRLRSRAASDFSWSVLRGGRLPYGAKGLITARGSLSSGASPGPIPACCLADTCLPRSFRSAQPTDVQTATTVTISSSPTKSAGFLV